MVELFLVAGSNCLSYTGWFPEADGEVEFGVHVYCGLIPMKEWKTSNGFLWTTG